VGTHLVTGSADHLGEVPVRTHNPHVGFHHRQDFVDANVTGTLTVLDADAGGGSRSMTA
jgi:hypothetical protein